MRKLLNTLYVTSPDVYLSLDGENVVVFREEEILLRVPLHTLESILYFGYKGASPALMGACAQRNIRLSFLTPNGRFLAAACGRSRGNVLVRTEQVRVADDLQVRVSYARNFLFGKVYNARWMLERAVRDHGLRLEGTRVKQVSLQLAAALPEIRGCSDEERLRGLEGAAAEQYFGVFDHLILQNKEDFFFRGRNRRPPLDNVNALLSFVYTLLEHDCSSALEAVGLDAYIGFLHRERPGRTSLAEDLMEELRSVMADRFVLTLINNRLVSPKGFEKQESGTVRMDDETRKTLLTAWQKKKQEEITHPFLGEKIPWGLVPYVQAMLLNRCLRGDLDEYPPFLWK